MVTNICVLASGSSGNVTAVWNEQGCLLIDFGASCAFVETSLRSIGCAPEQCNGIVFTHAHSDHIGAGALLFARRYRVPLYLHQETLPCVEERWDVARVRQCDPSLVVPHFDFPFTVGPFELIPFPASHSGGAVGRPLGFRISFRQGTKERCIGFLTDTGKVNDCMLEHLRDCDVVILEANHDPALVAVSCRHYLNKQWVLGDRGHLSNQAHASAIVELQQRSFHHKTPSHIFLAHISRDHNTIPHALEQIGTILRQHAVPSLLVPTYHRQKSEIITIE